MNSDKEISALFTKREYPLTIHTEGEGSVKERVVQPKTTDYAHGTIVELTAEPAEGWVFVKWEGDFQGEENQIEITIEESKEVTAFFKRDYFSFNLEIEGEGTVDVELESGNEVDGQFEFGSRLELTATADSGWEFSNWSGSFSGNDNPNTIEVGAENDVTANFNRQEFTLNIKAKGEGTVTEYLISGTDTEDGYLFESEVEITAHASSGWEFVEWQGDYTGSENPAELIVDSSKEITAIFELSDDSDPIVNISVSWSELESIIASKSKLEDSNQNAEERITHFGTRLVYVQENAVFTQSVERNNEDDQEIITLEVPPTEEAYLFVTAVDFEGTKKALLLGTLDNITMNQGTVYHWSIEDLDWIVPEWTVEEGLADEYSNGVITADKDDSDFELTLHVSDPYYSILDKHSSHVGYDDNMIKFNGTGSIVDSEKSKTRDFRFILENPETGNENTKFYDNIYPWLDSQMFGLPSARYIIYDTIEVEIRWVRTY